MMTMIMRWNRNSMNRKWLDRKHPGKGLLTLCICILWQWLPIYNKEPLFYVRKCFILKKTYWDWTPSLQIRSRRWRVWILGKAKVLINFSCRFLTPNYFFTLNYNGIMYQIWETSRNKLKMQYLYRAGA